MGFNETSASSEDAKAAPLGTLAGVQDDEAEGVVNQPAAPDKGAEDADLVACILKDHGKSLELGLVSAAADGVHAVSQSVCLTRHACLDLVPQKFQVEGAYVRGYCVHNPNVVVLTDDQVRDLL